MIPVRFFIVKFNEQRSGARRIEPNEEFKVDPATVKALREVAKMSRKMGHQFYAFYNFHHNEWRSEKVRATAFCSKSDAEDVAFEIIRQAPHLIGYVEVLALRHRVGPRWVLNRVRYCSLCGTCDIFARLKPAGYIPTRPGRIAKWECSDEYDCLRRRLMKMSKRGRNKRATGPIVMIQ